MKSRNNSLSSGLKESYKGAQPLDKQDCNTYSFEYQQYLGEISSDSDQEENEEQQKQQKCLEPQSHPYQKEQSIPSHASKSSLPQRVNLHKKLIEQYPEKKEKNNQNFNDNMIESQSDLNTSQNLQQLRQLTQVSDHNPLQKTSQFGNNSNDIHGSPLSFITSTINYDYTNNTPNENLSHQPHTISKSMLSEIMDRDRIISEKDKSNQELQDKISDYEFLLLKSTEELRKKQEEIELFKQQLTYNNSNINMNETMQQKYLQYSQLNLQQQYVLQQQNVSNPIINNDHQIPHYNQKEFLTSHITTPLKLDSTRKNSLSNQQNDSLISVISKKQEIINNIEYELRKKDETITKAHEVIKKITAEYSQLQQQNQEIVTKLEKVQRKKQEYKRKYSRSKQEIQEQIETMQQLQNEIQILSEKQNQNESLYAFKDSQLKKKDQLISSLQSQISSLQQEVRKNENEMQEILEMKKESDKQKQDFEKSEKEIEELKLQQKQLQLDHEQQVIFLKNEFSKTLTFYKQNQCSNDQFNEQQKSINNKQMEDIDPTEFDNCQIILTKPKRSSGIKPKSQTKSTKPLLENELAIDKKIFDNCEKIQQSIFMETLNRLLSRNSYINQFMKREDEELKEATQIKIQKIEELDLLFDKISIFLKKKDENITQLQEIIEQLNQRGVAYRHVNDEIVKNFNELQKKYNSILEMQYQNQKQMELTSQSIQNDVQQEKEQYYQMFDLSQDQLIQIQNLQKNLSEKKNMDTYVATQLVAELDTLIDLTQKEVNNNTIQQLSKLQTQPLQQLPNNTSNNSNNNQNLKYQIEIKTNQLRKELIQLKLNFKEIEQEKTQMLNSYSELENQIISLQKEKQDLNSNLQAEQKQNQEIKSQIEDIKYKSQVTLNTERSLCENKIKYYENKNQEIAQQYKQQFHELKQETKNRQNIIEKLSSQIQTTQNDDSEILEQSLPIKQYNRSYSANNLSSTLKLQTQNDEIKSNRTYAKEKKNLEHSQKLEKTIKTNSHNQEPNSQSKFNNTQRIQNIEKDQISDDSGSIKNNSQVKQIIKEYKEKMKQSFQKRIKELESVLKVVKEIIKGFDFTNLKYKVNCSKKVKASDFSDTEPKVQLLLNYQGSLQKNPNLKEFIDDITNIVNDLYEQNYFLVTGEISKIPLTLNPQKVIQISQDEIIKYIENRQKVNKIAQEFLVKMTQQQNHYEDTQQYKVLTILTAIYQEKIFHLIKDRNEEHRSDLNQILIKKLNSSFNKYCQEVSQNIPSYCIKMQLQNILDEYFDTTLPRTLLDKQIINLFQQGLQICDQNQTELQIGQYFSYLSTYKNRGNALLQEIHNAFRQQIELQKANTNYDLSKLSLHIAHLINQVVQQFYI